MHSNSRLGIACSVAVAALLPAAGCQGYLTGEAGSTTDVPEINSGTKAQASTPLRRLTQAQYNNTVRALLGLEGDFAEGFSPDEEAGGFASNVTVPVSLTQVEKYGQTAEDLAAQAVAGERLARLVPCAPPSGEDAACAEQFITDFGKRAFRRPLTAEEVDRYQTVYKTGIGSSGDFRAGVELTVAALLQSPHFLYIPELGENIRPVDNRLPLTGYEMASRLSYFLLGSMPDDELFEAADTGQLIEPDQIATQALRLLGTSAANESLVSFHRQWLMLNHISSIEKDENAYPDFTPALRQAMHDEVAAFVTGVLRDGDGRLETLLTADYSFINGPLYELYGLEQPANASTTTRVELPAGERAGLLTLAATLATFSHADQSSPVARGFLVSERLLCVTPPPAPPNVDTNVPAPDPSVTTRQRLETHRTEPSCSSCHGLMDPYGLTFENFDGIGRYRTHDGEQPVDATATLPDIGDVTDAVDLMNRLAESDEVRLCMVKNWFRYALGRVETEQDDATLSQVLGEFARSGYRISELLVALAQSPAFRYRAPIVQ